MASASLSAGTAALCAAKLPAENIISPNPTTTAIINRISFLNVGRVSNLPTSRDTIPRHNYAPFSTRGL